MWGIFSDRMYCHNDSLTLWRKWEHTLGIHLFRYTVDILKTGLAKYRETDTCPCIFTCKVYFSYDWCQWCRRYDDIAFPLIAEYRPLLLTASSGLFLCRHFDCYKSFWKITSSGASRKTNVLHLPPPLSATFTIIIFITAVTPASSKDIVRAQSSKNQVGDTTTTIPWWWSWV